MPNSTRNTIGGSTAPTAGKRAERRLAHARHGALPVTDPDGQYLGVLTAQTAAQALTDERATDPTADPPVQELIHLPRAITVESPLHEALDALVTVEQSGLPVLDETGKHLAGWITHQSLLAAVHKAHTPTTTAA